MYAEEYKQKVYKNWLERGSPWFDIDPSKEPTYAEKQIIIEMKKRQAGINVKKENNNEVKEFHALLNLDNY